METNAVTFHSIIFDMQVGVPIPVNGYPKDRRACMNISALIDTAASGSCISRRFAREAKLKSFKRTKIRGFHGNSTVPVYNVDIFLPNGIILANMDVAEFQGGDKFDFIIGMNILRMGDMALTNAKGKMALTFRMPPAETPIDFVEEEK